ncbi:hypothetical protein AMECASPLE_012976 [Ameca splendens]|uniref:Uncharacterized protein n=1 Tax=Ameca splendens TaxID=208324 RepID=A0ABV0XEB4_9TELE
MGGSTASLGDGAVADEDVGLLGAAFTSAGMGPTSLPTELQEVAPRRRFLRREEDVSFTARSGRTTREEGSEEGLRFQCFPGGDQFFKIRGQSAGSWVSGQAGAQSGLVM